MRLYGTTPIMSWQNGNKICMLFGGIVIKMMAAYIAGPIRLAGGMRFSIRKHKYAGVGQYVGRKENMIGK